LSAGIWSENIKQCYALWKLEETIVFSKEYVRLGAWGK
jgi:hypothetical protein